MPVRLVLLAFILCAHSMAQFPKAYTADAVAGPSVLPPGEGSDAKKLLILQPAGIAMDAQNNAYVSDEKFNRVVKITPGGVFTTVPAPQSGLWNPKGLAMDRAGNLYIANKYANTIVRVTPDGTAATYAGTGATTGTGDGKAPLQTELGFVEYLAVDAQGNVYFTEEGGFKIRKIPAGGGAIETYAGTGTAGYSVQSGPAKQIPLGSMYGIFMGADNNLYVLDGLGANLRRITPEGTSQFLFDCFSVPMKTGTTTPAGWKAGPMYGGWADADGTLWVTMQWSPSIVKCPGRKDCEVVAGSTGAGYNGDGSPARQKKLGVPMAMAKDSQGNFLFLDRQRVRMLTPAGELRTLAGGDTATLRGDGQKNSRVFIEPSRGVAVDAQNNVYASDEWNHLVWRFGADGIASIVAGTGTPGYSGDGGSGRAAELNEPGNLALDGAGNLYIADVRNYVIRKVTPQGQISTFAGRAHVSYEYCPANPATAVATQWCFGSVASVAADAQGNVWVLGGGNVVRITGGNASVLSSTSLVSLATGRDGNLYAIGGNQVLRSSQGTGAFTVVAGTGKYGSSGDGGLATAAEINPTAVASDANRNLLIADFSGRTIRAVTADGKIRTIAGGGLKTGTVGDGGPSTDVRVNAAQMATGSNGRIYYASPGFSSNVFRDIHTWLFEPAQLFRTAVLNAASYKGGAVAGGEIVTIYGVDIGPKTLTTYEVVNGKFRDEIAGTRVLFDGVPAPIIYVSETAASVVVPYGVAGKSETEMWIEYQGTATNRLKMPVTVTQPGVFTIPPIGTGQAAMLHWPDYSVNNASNALAREGVAMLFLTGGGEQGQDGMLAQTAGSLPFPVKVQVGGIDAQVLYAGPAPTLIYGMLQINFIVPAGVTPGNKVQLYVKLGEVWSQAGLTIAVK